MRKLWLTFLALGLTLAVSTVLTAQAGSPPTKSNQSPVKKLRDGVYLIDVIEVDTRIRELRIPATVNPNVTTLEFVANTIGGNKAYESALTVATDAVKFNTALLLVGVDPKRSRVPRFHFDPIPPAGDPLEISIEWRANGAVKRVPIEELLFDERRQLPMPAGPWVYTGSKMVDGRYLADMDGILIGFVHSPAPVIENPRPGASGAYGSVVLNTRLGLAGGTKVTLVIRLLPPGSGRR